MFKSLSLETLKRDVPSIFSDQKYRQMSERYQYISTVKIIEGLINKGFLPTKAYQSACRIKDKKAHTKHMIRFRHRDATPTVSGLFPEIILINSHDGSSSYKLISGLFRVVCGNGLIAGNRYGEVRVRHQGNIMGAVIEGTYEVISNATKMLTVAKEMENIQLNETEKNIFAEAAHNIRFEDKEANSGINPSRLLEARRSIEKGKSDLFTVFNIVQENVIKGGLIGYKRDKYGRLKLSRTRVVKGIDQDTYLNRALWTLAEEMMRLKSEGKSL